MAETSRPAFVAGTTARRRNAMRALVGALLLALVSASTASAQATGGAEDNLKQKNITLPPPVTPVANYVRSEEHTSELQSRLHLVCRLLLEKKKHTHKR